MVSRTLTLTPISSSTFLSSKPLPAASTSTSLTKRPFCPNTTHHHGNFSRGVLICRPFYHNTTHHHGNFSRNVLICRGGLSDEAPFVVAIGTSMLSSLLLATPATKEDDADSLIDSTDTRFGVMGIISFIPFFNWLSWVFAWLDTGKRRYAVYAFVYLLPYLRSNISLSPEESWLPIASFIFCIIHVQLETSIRNGDLQGFQLFNMAAKDLSLMTKHKANRFDGHQEISKEERKREHMNLPHAEEQWRVPQKPSEHSEDFNGDGEDDKREN